MAFHDQHAQAHIAQSRMEDERRAHIFYFTDGHNLQLRPEANLIGRLQAEQYAAAATVVQTRAAQRKLRLKSSSSRPIAAGESMMLLNSAMEVVDKTSTTMMVLRTALLMLRMKTMLPTAITWNAVSPDTSPRKPEAIAEMKITARIGSRSHPHPNL